MKLRRLVATLVAMVTFWILVYTNAGNSGYLPNEAETPLEWLPKQQRLRTQHRWWSLPYVETNDACFHRTWHYFVTDIARQWPDLIQGFPPGNLTGEGRVEVEKLVGTLGAKCRHFLEAGHIRRPAVYSVIRSDPEQQEVVTLVTQLGHNRFDSLELILDSWQAAISATIYVPSEEMMSFVEKLCTNKALQSRSNVDIHIVLKYGDLYPINFLRNVALNGTKTELAYLSDVDFVPSAGIDQSIREFWLENKSFFDRNVLVIPAFEMLSKDVQAPRNKAELIKLLDKGPLIPARKKKWPKGHMPTDYKKWRNTNGIYKVNYTEDYEPYIVMKTSAAPKYKHMFVERYKDKSSQLLEVWAKGFQYQVLASSFAIHYPHKYTDITTAKNVYKCALAVNRVYQERIKKQYNILSIPQFKS